MKATDALSLAIKSLPTREKDKLLLRLIRKDKILVEQLHYQLIEGGETQLDRRKQVSFLIEELLDRPSHPLPTLLKVIREANRHIQHHVKITKDSYGEVALYMELLNHLFAYHGAVCRSRTFSHRKINQWLDHRIPWLAKKYAKLEEDYRLDFEKDWLAIQAQNPK